MFIFSCSKGAACFSYVFHFAVWNKQCRINNSILFHCWKRVFRFHQIILKGRNWFHKRIYASFSRALFTLSVVTSIYGRVTTFLSPFFSPLALLLVVEQLSLTFFLCKNWLGSHCVSEFRILRVASNERHLAWEDAKIICRENKWCQRKWKEAWLIEETRNAIANKDNGRVLQRI